MHKLRKVETALSIKTKPQVILDAFLKADLLKEWWGVERCLVEPEIGGVYTLAWGISDNGFNYLMTGIIQKYIKKSKLKIENLVYLNPEKKILGPMTLSIDLLDKGGECVIILKQDGYESGDDWDWYYDAVKKAWPETLLGLKNYLENQYKS
jgi:hypothetical protein